MHLNVFIICIVSFFYCFSDSLTKNNIFLNCFYQFPVFDGLTLYILILYLFIYRFSYVFTSHVFLLNSQKLQTNSQKLLQKIVFWSENVIKLYIFSL